MGEVYLMQDERISRQVAIKVLRVEESEPVIEAKSAGAVRLFEREARAIAALDHPHILPLYDFGEEVTSDGNMAYMVMSYCADGSLETWLRQQGKGLLPPPRVAMLIEQAAEGLQYAHDHRPTPRPTHIVQATVTAKPTAAPPGKYIAGHYNGSMAANDGSQSASITVFLVQTQGSSLLSGAVTFNSATSSTLKGTDDMQGHFSFSVGQPAGQLPLVFYGSYTVATNLHGYYCRSNTGSCLADIGYFTVGPQY